MIGRNPLVTLARAIVLGVVCVILFRAILIPVEVSGRSMEPSYRNGRVTFINRLAYRRADPQRGDVVGLRREGSRMLLLKRIVGLPGERVAVRDGRVLIDGRQLIEPYAQGTHIPPTREETMLGPDQYFAIGDNRDLSTYGVVHRAEIQGKALF